MKKQSPGKERPSILVVGDAVAATGFARVLHSIFDRLRHSYDIYHLGINFFGDPHEYDWNVYVAGLGGDVYGANRLPSLVERVRPKLVFILADLWIVVRYMPALEQYADTLKIVVYLPVDGGPLDPTLIEQIAGINHLVVFNRFGRRVVEEAFEAAREEQPDLPVPAISTIPHGVDTDIFHPYRSGVDTDRKAGRKEAKRALLPPGPEFQDSFIVLNANRNQPRKRIDLTMQGFALFARDKPANVKLYLHMGSEDLGWNILSLARRLNLESRLIITGPDKRMPSDSVERLNLIYNCCEVGLNTSTGEGWGLVSFEHAATGAAQVVPRHTSCEELWKDAAELVDPVFTLTTERVLTEGHYVAPEGVAAALERLYSDPAHLERLSSLASANATRPQYSWDRIARQWDRLFRQILAG